MPAQYRFSWDPAKAASNRKKHGVTFAEASTVFADPLLLVYADWEHGEQRVVALGLGSSGRVLYVVSVERAEGEIRIVSARRATKHERRRYEEEGS